MWVTSVIWLALLVLLKNLGIQGVGVNKSFPYHNRTTHIVWCLTVPYFHRSTIVLKIRTVVTKRTTQHSTNILYRYYCYVDDFCDMALQLSLLVIIDLCYC